jgi:hypothetical protein
MALEIDVYSGTTKVGSGPITTATGWRQTARLDRVGEFAFTCSASDPQAAQLVNRRTVYAYESGALIGGGIIDNIQKAVGGDGVPMVQVSGPDLAVELTWCRTGEVSISTQGWQRATSISTVLVSGWNGGGKSATAFPGAYDGSTATWGRLDLYEPDGAPPTTDVEPWHKWFYIGGASPFSQISFNCGLDTTGPSTGYPGGRLALGTLQYLDSVGWVSATVGTDGTSTGTNSFVQSGTITWTASTGGTMHQTTELGTAAYHLRGHLPNNADGLMWYEVQTYGPAPTANALHCIASALPASSNGYVGTWSFASSAGSTNTTSTGVYDTLYEENCFEALTKVAEMTGEHFYCTPGRKIVWIGRVTAT